MKKVIIIGSGPAGYPAALRLKSLGADVKIVENWTFGGTCLNRGCIPSKAILEVAHRYHNFKDILSMSEGSFDVKLSWKKIKEHKIKVVEGLRSSLEKLFTMKKIDIIKGKARIISEKKIEVTNGTERKEYDFDNLIIATGTVPSYPPPFSEHREILTDSDKIFDIEKKPDRLIIIGGGVIGIEMACFFNAAGTDVTVIDIMPDILPFEDKTVSKLLKTSLEKRGVKFYLAKKIVDIKIEGNNKILIDDAGERYAADEIMVAAGRVANLYDLNIDAAGIKHNKFIETDMKMMTSNPRIYACGDINGISLLAHSATRQGEIAAENIMGKSLEFDKNIVPSCIYSWPEVGSVGLNPDKARESGIEFKIKKSYFQALPRAIASGNIEGFCQIVIDSNERIIGAQIVGGPATEIIHTLALAIKFNMKADDLRSIIFAHPTMSEIIMETLNR
ncbi:MAG: dihydrolipoyl dehydrogenase [Elusimicrobiales bacterium]|nr:dihydrolipoyl dehydrogenase [Elusimicrobiales bacterium]